MKSDLPRVPCPSTPIDAPPASPSVERELAAKRAAARMPRRQGWRASAKTRTCVVQAYKKKEKRKALECSVCGKRGGFVVSCADDRCGMRFHPLCAWYKGHYFLSSRCPVVNSSDNSSSEGDEDDAVCSRTSSFRCVKNDRVSTMKKLFRSSRSAPIIDLKVWCLGHDPARKTAPNRVAIQLKMRTHYRMMYPIKTLWPGGGLPSRSGSRKRKTAAEQREARIRMMQRLGEARANSLSGSSAAQQKKGLRPYDTFRGPPIEADAFENGVCAICGDYSDVMQPAASSSASNSLASSSASLLGSPPEQSPDSRGSNLVQCDTCGLCASQLL